MKKLVVSLIAVATMFAVKAESLANARLNIDKAINDSAVLLETMKGLSAADQKSFLADINTAIAKMPAAPGDRVGRYVDANRFALMGAAKDNTLTLLAEVFATVPPDALTLLSEVFAQELFNRGADSNQSFSDEHFEKIAKEVISKIAERTAGGQDAEVRNVLAVTMFVRASNGTIEDLALTLTDVAVTNPKLREEAKSEWIPSALEGDYSVILASTGSSTPDLSGVSILVATGNSQPMLAALASGMEADDAFAISEMVNDHMGSDHDLSTIPRTTDPMSKANPSSDRDLFSKDRIEPALYEQGTVYTIGGQEVRFWEVNPTTQKFGKEYMINGKKYRMVPADNDPMWHWHLIYSGGPQS